MIEKTKFKTEINYLTIDRHGSQYSDFTFVKVVKEDEDIIFPDSGEVVSLTTDETRKISTGFCRSLK